MRYGPGIVVAVCASIVLALLALALVAWPASTRAMHVQQVGFTIRPGDRVSKPNIALAPGVPVRITVTNTTREFHTFTAPRLGLSRLIRPARGHSATRTTFSFTPHRQGVLAWHCAICPSGIHGRPHGMRGLLYLIIDPSVLP